MSEDTKPYKHVQLSLADGRTYQIEAQKIANDYAHFYASTAGNGGKDYRDDYDRIIASTEDLEDWLMNNMDWYELSPVLINSTLPELCDAQVVAKNYFY